MASRPLRFFRSFVRRAWRAPENRRRAFSALLAVLAVLLLIIHPLLHADAAEHPKCLICALAGKAVPAGNGVEVAVCPPPIVEGAWVPSSDDMGTNPPVVGTIQYRGPPLASS